MNERILACTHAGDGALGALRMANALAERDGSPVDVLAVVPTVFMEGLTLYAFPTGLVPEDAASVERFRQEVRAQLAGVGGAVARVEPRVEIGQVSHTIAGFAQSGAAGLILLGAGRHDVATRLVGGETSLYVSRMARVPVLAVPADAERIPRSAVAAVDFSEYSRDAARTAARLMGPGGVLHLVHATWFAHAEMRAGGDWLADYLAGARGRLHELADVLQRETGVEVHTEIDIGDPVPSLLQRVRDAGAELLAAGSHGHGFFTRMLLGSTSTRLLRGAGCAVLIAPPRAAWAVPRQQPVETRAQRPDPVWDPALQPASAT